ncbi:MAG: Hsp20/alpha crystallin family protein [Bdellovibrionales bacterium]|nr:Hsp20/alpha crystallin family protein [Bdellovibrionales bacterium]
MLPALRTVSGSVLPSLLLEDWPFEQVVRNLNGGSNGATHLKFFPLDVAEYSDRYTLQMEVAGIRRENIDISFEDNSLSIQIERKAPSTQEEAKYLHRGRWFGSTIRTVSLPEAASGEEIEAHLKDGVLTIEVKKQPERQARKIEIKDLN